MPIWSELPSELLQLVYKHLNLTGQLRFGLVCKSWLLVANKKPYPPAPEHPWLMTKRGNHKEPYEFLSITDKRVYKMYKFPQHESIKGCSEGWLVTKKDRELLLLNPISNVQIQLPHHCQFTYVPDLCKIKKAIMLHGPDTFVAVLFSLGNLAICKVGEQIWRNTSTSINYDDIIFYKGKLYATYIDHDNQACFSVFSVYDYDRFSVSLVPESAFCIGFARFSLSTYLDTSIYLVESCGDLLMVTSRHRQIGFDVFKLEVNGSQGQYIKIKDLQDQVLFLGYGYSLSLASQNSPPGLKGNHIYCSGSYFHDCKVVFSLKDGSIKSLPPRMANLEDPIWFTPTLT